MLVKASLFVTYCMNKLQCIPGNTAKLSKKIQSTLWQLVPAPCCGLAQAATLPPLSCFSATLQ